MLSTESQQKLRGLEALQSAWRDASLAPAPIAAIGKAFARLQAIGQEAAAAQVLAEASLDRAADALAAGAPFVEALRLAHDGLVFEDRSGTGLVGLGHKLLDRARAAAITAAVHALDEPGTVLQALEQAREHLAAELAELSQVLRDTQDAEQAVGDRKTAAAWSRLQALEEHREALARIWSALRKLRIARSDPPIELRQGVTCERLMRRTVNASAP